MNNRFRPIKPNNFIDIVLDFITFNVKNATIIKEINNYKFKMNLFLIDVK